MVRAAREGCGQESKKREGIGPEGNFGVRRHLIGRNLRQKGRPRERKRLGRGERKRVQRSLWNYIKVRGDSRQE